MLRDMCNAWQKEARAGEEARGREGSVLGYFSHLRKCFDKKTQQRPRCVFFFEHFFST